MNQQGLKTTAPPSSGDPPTKLVSWHSAERLLRRPVELAGGVVVAAETRHGRLVVRVEQPQPRGDENPA